MPLIYAHWLEPAVKRNVTFDAWIARINDQLRRDPFRWSLAPAGRQDWKPERVTANADLIVNGVAIMPPEFSLNHRGADITDGRHRIYAFHDAGYAKVRIQCRPEDKAELAALLS